MAVLSSTPDRSAGGLRGGGRGHAPGAVPSERRVAERRRAEPRRGNLVQEPGRDADQRTAREATRLDAGPPVSGGPLASRGSGRAVPERLRLVVPAHHAVARKPGYVVIAREPPGQLRAGREVRVGDLCGLGAQGRGGRPGRGGLRRAAGDRRSGAAGRRRVELRRHAHLLCHRPGPAIQGGDQRSRQLQHPGRVRHGRVRPGIRGRARRAVAEPGYLAQGLVPVPARGPDHHADAVHGRQRGLQPADAELRADVSGAARAWAARPSW